MKINTKVIFEWNDESKQYEEVYCESYDYDGEVAECQIPDQQSFGLGDMFNISSTLAGTAMPYLAIGGMVAGGIAGHYGAQKQEDLIRKQQSKLLKAGQSLQDIYGQKMGIYQEQYGEQLEQASYGTGESLFDIQQSGESVAGRTGLSYSGTVQTGLKRSREGVKKQFGFTKTGLENILGGQVMGLEEWKAGEEDRIAAERERLEYELKEAEAKSDWNPFT